jgi:hypothetical protein
MIGVKLRQKSMHFRVVSPTESSWQQLLDTLPHDFYHLPGYLELESTRYDAIPEAIIIQDNDRIFFLPYLVRECAHIFNSTSCKPEPIYDVISPYGYSGVLVNEVGRNGDFIRKCWNLIYDYWQQKNICSAFIRLHPILNGYIDDSITDGKSIFGKQGDVVTCDLTKDFQDIWKQIRANHRTKINKLSRAGFTARIESVDEYLDVFIDIYRETMDRVRAVDTYYFTPDYFKKLSQTLGDRIKICVVEIEGQIVAASLITEFSGIIEYHLGGTRTEFLPKSPATLMFKHIIEWGKYRNNQCLNLGGGLGGKHDSLYHFKSGFSDEFQSFATIKIIVDRERYTRLMAARAESLGISIIEIENTSFFPAYRAS